MDGAEESSRRPARRRRWPVVVLALLVLALAAWAAASALVRPGLERALSDALGTPVSIGYLWWRPLAREVVAGRVAVGSGGDAIALKSLAVEVPLASLWRRELAVDRIAVESPEATLRFDADYQLVSPVLGAKPAKEPEGKTSEPPSATTLPQIGVRELVVTGGKLTLVYPVGKKMHEGTVEVTRLTASDIATTADGAAISLRAVFDGAIDGAPVSADTALTLGGPQREISGTVKLSGFVLSPDVLPLPEAFAGLGGALDATATYESAPKTGTPLLKLDLRLKQPQLAGRDDAKIGARAVSLPQVRIDPAKAQIDLGAVAVDQLELDAVLTDTGIVLPLADAAGAGSDEEPLWKIAAGAIQIRGGEVRLHRGDAVAKMAIASARLQGFAAGERRPVALEARFADGGVLTVQGELGLTPVDASLRIGVQQLSLPLWADFAGALPLELAEGSGAADLQLHYRDDTWRLSGRVEADGVRTAPPLPERPAEVLALHHATADVSVDPASTPMVDVSSLRLSYPYVMVQRHADDLFPYSLWIGEARGGEAPPPSTRATDVRVRRLEVEGGKLEFMDMTLTPAYWTALAGVELDADEISLPPPLIEHFELSARHDELSPVDVAGSLTAAGLEVRAEMQDVLLESMNAYVAPLLGYRVTSGRLSMSAAARPAPSSLESVIEVVLRGVDVLQTGTDVIQSESGVPLPVALSLIANAAGQIDLTLPITVDTSSGKLSFGSVVGQAVRRAIVGALTSPLRILGSLFGTKGAPHAFAVAPVPFATGSSDLDDAGRRRVDEIARIVSKHAGLLIVTQPQVTAADIAGVGAAGAAALAQDRQDAVREALLEAAGPALAPKRLVPAAWTSDVGAKATGQPSVYVELQDAD